MKLYVLYLRDARAVYGEKGLCGATDLSAGLDLRACFDAGEIVIDPGERIAVPTGISAEPRPKEGETPAAGFVYSRSGLGAVKGLTVAQGVGVIDADYRGEIIVWLLNTSSEAKTVRRGDRIAQLVYHSLPAVRIEECSSLSGTERGSGGFGHTGSR